MAWIPVVVASQSENNINHRKRIVIALIVLLLLGTVILISQFGVFNYFANFQVSFVFITIIFLLIFTMVISAISFAAFRRNNQNPYPYHYNEQSSQKFNEKVEKEIEYEKSISSPYRVESFVRGKTNIRYCSYYGTYISPDTKYCPDCGKKIDIID